MASSNQQQPEKEKEQGGCDTRLTVRPYRERLRSVQVAGCMSGLCVNMIILCCT